MRMNMRICILTPSKTSSVVHVAHSALKWFLKWFSSTSEFICLNALSFTYTWSVVLSVFKCSAGDSLAGFGRGWPMTGDQCMAEREQIDLTSVFFSHQHQMFISFSKTDSEMWDVVWAHPVRTWLWKALSPTGADWGWQILLICLSLVGVGLGHVGGEAEMHFDGVLVKQTTRRETSGIGCHWADIKWWAVRLVLFSSLTSPPPESFFCSQKTTLWASPANFGIITWAGIQKEKRKKKKNNLSCAKCCCCQGTSSEGGGTGWCINWKV